MSLIKTLTLYDKSQLVFSKPIDSRLIKQVEKLQKKADGLDDPKPLNSFEIDKAILAVIKNVATKKDYKIVCTSGLNSLILHDHGKLIIKFIFKKCEQFGSVLYKSLLIGYLIFPIEHTAIGKLIKTFLNHNLDKLPSRWKKRVDNYHLLDNDVGSFFVDQILSINMTNLNDFIRNSGVSGLKMNGSVGLNIFNEFCRRLATDFDLTKMSYFEYLFKLDDDIRFSSYVKEYSYALLSPFRDRTPSSEEQHHNQDFLIKHFGDPRISKSKWIGVDERDLAVINRWLAASAFELLLSVVNKSNDTSQWAQREKFWKYYFDEDYITDAWVALGPNAAYEAKKLVKSGELKSTGEFAVITGGGVNADHSMLLLKIGKYIISEWTHSGKLRIYRETNRYAPLLYQKSYDTYKIRADNHADFYMAHHASWRPKLASVLHYQANAQPKKEFYSYSTYYDASFRCDVCNRAMHNEFKEPYFTKKICRSCANNLEK